MFVLPYAPSRFAHARVQIIESSQPVGSPCKCICNLKARQIQFPFIYITIPDRVSLAWSKYRRIESLLHLFKSTERNLRARWLCFEAHRDRHEPGCVIFAPSATTCMHRSGLQAFNDFPTNPSRYSRPPT